jgi:hypothetical protein
MPLAKASENAKTSFLSLLPLCAFTQFTHRASSQSTHHLVAEEHSSTLEHGSQRVFNDISEIIKKISTVILNLNTENGTLTHDNTYSFC